MMVKISNRLWDIESDLYNSAFKERLSSFIPIAIRNTLEDKIFGQLQHQISENLGLTFNEKLL